MNDSQATTRTADKVLVDDIHSSVVDIHLARTRRRVLVAVLIAILLILTLSLVR